MILKHRFLEVTQLKIDGKALQPQPGQSLREIIQEQGMDTATLSTRPLAARIAGEVFT